MTELFASPEFWGSLVTLTFLEIVLGIDNLLFVSIAVGNLKGKEQKRAQRIGVWGAMVLRIVMLGGDFLDHRPRQGAAVHPARLARGVRRASATSTRSALSRK